MLMSIPIIRKEKVPLQTELITVLANTISSHPEQPVLFLYSGGSSLQLMTDFYDATKNLDLSNLIFAPVDERKDENSSNAGAFQKMSVFKKFEEKGANFVQLNDFAIDLATAADQYNEQIRILFEDVLKHDGISISLLGMGADGHTAGIFPYPENPEFFENMFVNTDRYVVGYNVGDKNPHKERITLTLIALRNVDYTFVYVVGEDKREALNDALSIGAYADVPGRIWGQLPNCSVFTDILL